MVEFTIITYRKNVNRRIRTEQKLLEVEVLFKWSCLYWFLDRVILFALEIYLFL